MNKSAENRHSFVEYIKKGYGSLFTPFMKVQVQMPKEQIATYLKLAVKKRFPIVIQVNPTSQSEGISEFTGIPYFSPKSTQIIIKSDTGTITYLVNARDIRHIRKQYRLK